MSSDGAQLLYLVTILDVASRKVLAFRLSDTLAVGSCVEAPEEAISRFGVAEIFTDFGHRACQYIELRHRSASNQLAGSHHVSLIELQTVRGKLGLPIERDRHFEAANSISAYAEEARQPRRIVAYSDFGRLVRGARFYVAIRGSRIHQGSQGIWISYGRLRACCEVRIDAKCRYHHRSAEALRFGLGNGTA